MELAVDDQLAEPRLAAIDDRSRERVEAYRRRDHLAVLPGGRLGQPGRGVLGVGEAADRAHLGRQDRGWPEDGVGRGHQSLADRLVYDQRAAGDIARGEDVRRGRA
jgi:hypothetical protein